MKYLFSIMLSLLSGAGFLCAQDIIIKNDKTEIKCKVAEITVESIKYKKWEMPDGPLYNINKTDVFMIVYSNGQREIIKQSANNAAANTYKDNLQNNATPVNTQPENRKQVRAGEIDTTIDFENVKVKYKPTRLLAAFQSPITIGTDQEFRIIKNMLNGGISYYYSFPEDDYILESNG